MLSECYKDPPFAQSWCCTGASITPRLLRMYAATADYSVNLEYASSFPDKRQVISNARGPATRKDTSA